MSDRNKKPKADKSSPWYMKAAEQAKRLSREAAAKGILGNKAKVAYGKKK